MGIEPFLLASSLVGALAQRLARRICDDCKQPMEIAAGLRKRLTASGIAVPAAAWAGAGCSHCRNTGYSRRVGVFEMMPITPALADLITANVPTAHIKAQARKDGMVSMLEDGIAKVGQGITTLQEVMRIAELEMVMDDVKATPSVESVPAEPEKAPPGGHIGLDLEEYRNKMASWLAGK
jgi:type IV pilus assembly protein PilB